MTPLKERDRLRLEREKKAGAKSETTNMSKSERMSGDSFNLKDMSFEAKFTIDEEGLRGLAAFLKEQEDETLDAIFSGKQGLILHDPKRGTAELRVEPIRHGFWKYIRNSSLGLKICECSVCHKRTYGSLRYCANCGAKMDGEV